MPVFLSVIRNLSHDTNVDVASRAEIVQKLSDRLKRKLDKLSSLCSRVISGLIDVDIFLYRV